LRKFPFFLDFSPQLCINGAGRIHHEENARRIFKEIMKRPEKAPPENADCKGGETGLHSLNRDLELKIADQARDLEAEISRRKASDEALRQLEERYRTLFEESKDAIFFCDLEGRFIAINRAGVELLGFESKEALLAFDSPIGLIPHEDDRQKMLQILGQNGSFKDTEITFRTKEGRDVIGLVTVMTVKDGAGNPVAYHGITRDITEKRRLERQLIQSQKMEAVGLMAGGISHDFNNLLTVILGNSELGMMKLSPSDPAYVIISRIQDAAERASRITQKLLALGRKQMLQPKVIDPGLFIRNASETFEKLLGKEIKLQIEIEDDLEPVFADKEALEQAIVNLLHNSREAMTQGGSIGISVRNFRVDNPFHMRYPFVQQGDYAWISIRDTGVGIDEKTLERIFDPFFTTKKSGSGLGLSIVYSIMKQHMGYCIATSLNGNGAQFDLYIPAHRETALRVATPKTTDSYYGKETILLADDEEGVRMVIKSFLDVLGYQVLTAADGEEAWEMFRSAREPIDLVILDGIMPKMSGPAACEKIRSYRPGTPCLFLSGFSEELRVKFLGKNPFPDVPLLRKPVTIEELGKKVRELLDR
jgi:two-component system, cell cycle sensor histidine kinase and response regulator CckA